MPPAHTVAHAVLMALMVVALGTAVVFARLKRGGWMARHRLIASAGAVLGAAGVATMAVAKLLNGWSHLATSHSKVGLPALVLVLAAPVLGTLLVKGRTGLRQVHRTVGAVSILISIAAAVLGSLMV
jgi:hypothetical protein